MTRKEAIDVLNSSNYFWCRPTAEEKEALIMAIEALEKAQLSDKGTTFDCISRQDAIDAMYCLNPTSAWIHIDDVIEALNELPSAEPERTGHWLPDNTFYYETRFVCSECHNSERVPTIGFTKYKPIWDYCPNCGCKMEVEHE